MKFALRLCNASNILVRKGSFLYPLSEYQLLEILKFQKNEPYDEKWLKNANTTRPYFNSFDGLNSFKHFLCVYRDS